jgi:hypothetical protein
MKKYIVLLFLLSGASTYAASLPAFTVDSPYNASGGPYYIGFEFQVTSPQSVTALGVLDINSDATMPSATGVGIYSVAATCCDPKSATAVITAIVPQGTSPTNDGALNAFFVSVSPTVLTPGDYVILTEGAHEGWVQSPLTFQPGMSYVDGWFGGSSFPGVGNNLTVTNQSNGSQAWISATFESESATPEPGTWTTAAMAALLAVIAFRRRFPGRSLMDCPK